MWGAVGPSFLSVINFSNDFLVYERGLDSPSTRGLRQRRLNYFFMTKRNRRSDGGNTTWNAGRCISTARGAKVQHVHGVLAWFSRTNTRLRLFSPAGWHATLHRMWRRTRSIFSWKCPATRYAAKKRGKWESKKKGGGGGQGSKKKRK